MNDRVFIKDVLYGLKLEYGERLVITKPVNTIDLDTGGVTSTSTQFVIQNGILMPTNLRALFAKLIGINRFVYLEQGEREILIDNSDIPTGQILEIHDRVVPNSTNRTEEIVRKPEVFDYGTILVTKQ